MKNSARAVIIFLVATGISAQAEESPTAPPGSPARPVESLLLTPTDRVLVQRGFVPFRGLKRFYACVVGSPLGLHYAYDTETGALLYLWRGRFVDVAEMWAGRAFNQTALPAADPLLEFSGLPLLAQFPDRLLDYPAAWPDRPDPLYASLGYELSADGSPVFLARLSELNLRDRLTVTPDGHGLTRTLEFTGRLSLWENWLLLAEGQRIERAGDTYTISPGGGSIEWPSDSKHRPVIVDTPGRQQLRLLLRKDTFQIPVSYQLSWSPVP